MMAGRLMMVWWHVTPPVQRRQGHLHRWRVANVLGAPSACRGCDRSRAPGRGFGDRVKIRPPRQRACKVTGSTTLTALRSPPLFRFFRIDRH